ncbi:MAG: shikimate dehydrogenase [Runella slithyformis]|nr:MAG: shikimate dehydrogenase [Runella slithyformis]TAE98376.1 MAG: shikimate dehydrogenase [Runella slithyformis]TAF26705.1 MAG: shikimate dehydrogenase [Runella slithyformis]TAF48635.1 MAG: shikimate dehydrogenase [Runella slithyformis]TAF81722.1 MAG: shikimate dehydrogenase [Runella slithyformis]
MKLFALIGYPLKHSFSKKYFTEKFERENIPNCRYELLELPDCQAFRGLLAANPDLVGLNVTIPHKQAVIPFLDQLDPASAARIGAVNTIKILPDGRKIGYNTDYYGFKTSLENWLSTVAPAQPMEALVLGNGGAAKAVFAALTDLQIPYRVVSRQAAGPTLTYADLTPEIVQKHRLIVNTSPVGTFPNVEECPQIPYKLLTSAHLLYDLVYNPAETLFLQKGEAQGAATHNGLLMLQLQAEKAWEIWNE